MKIKSNNWMVWLIESTFGIRAKTLCSFFWLLVSSIILTPLSYLAHVANYFFPSQAKIQVWHSAFLLFACGSMGFAFTEKLNIINKHTAVYKQLLYTWACAPCMLIVLIAFIGIVFLIVYGVILLFAKIKSRKRMSYQEANALGEKQANKKPGIISEFLKAKKQKYCPMIEYIDEHEIYS